MSSKSGRDDATGGLVVDSGRHGRLMLDRVAVPELVGWLIVMWQRQSNIIDSVRSKDPQVADRYTRSTIDAASSRMEAIQELIDQSVDTFKSKDYAEALLRVGMMVGAADAAGNRLTKVGRVLAGAEGPGDGTATG